VTERRIAWHPSEPKEAGRKFRASLEALAYLIALGLREHEDAGQKITRITISGGIARSPLMCEILATVLDRPLERLRSDEGPALGAAVTALASLEAHLRKLHGIAEPFGVADAIAQMVKFREPVAPNAAWRQAYQKGLAAFGARLKQKPTGKDEVEATKKRPETKLSAKAKSKKPASPTGRGSKVKKK
jgi:sugar (pentulose or hexulose) kinase